MFGVVKGDFWIGMRNSVVCSLFLLAHTLSFHQVENRDVGGCVPQA